MATATVTRVCKKCNTTILDAHAYELGDDCWHTHCFKCLECELLLGCNSNFLVLGDGNLICSNCTYNCKQCGKKIDDLAILTGDQAYCSNCFKCRACKLKIEDLRYARTLKGVFCMSCHDKLMAKKKKYDSKRRQMAQLGLQLRSGLEQVTALGSTASIPLLSSDLQTNASLVSLLNKQLPPHPPASEAAPPAQTDVVTGDLASAKSGLPANAGNPPSLLSPHTHGHSLVPGSYPKSILPPVLSESISFNEASHNNLSASIISSMSSTADIEEVNDSDDELNLRRMREKLQRRFDRLTNKDSKDSGAILDLIDSFSGPNTPNTIYTVADGVDSSPAISVKVDQELPKQTISLKDSESGKTKLKPNLLDPVSPRKNFLLLSPNQFQDHEFHNAKSVSSDFPSITLSPEGINRPVSTASSPMAKANRKARVVETNDEIPTAEISTDTIIDSDITLSNLRGNRSNNGIPSSPIIEKTPHLQSGELHYPMSTPRKSPAEVSHLMSSPPPGLALPEIPSTPQQKSHHISFEPHGLGLEGIEFLRPSRAAPATPAVTNLEDTIGENEQGEDASSNHTPAGRKLNVRRKMLLKHKRSTSGGLGLSGKFGFFKNKEDESKGHTRHVLEGSIQGLAYATPPLPFSSPLQGMFRENHTRSTSDTQYISSTESEVYKNELELRSLRVEVYQLENRRQTLLSDNMRLGSDKSRIQEAIKALLKKLQTETQVHEQLIQKILELKKEKKALSEKNEHLREFNDQLKQQAITLEHAQSRTQDRFGNNKYEKEFSQRLESWNDTIESEILEENSETQKATRLKFWRRPKVSMAPQLISMQYESLPQLLAGHGFGGASNNGSHGLLSTGQNHKLSQSHSSNAFQIPNLSNNEDSSTRKTLNSLISKSRSTTILDTFASGGSSNGGDVPLFSSTIQRRALYENEKVPIIITKCIEEVESRGLDTEGIYRISGGSSAVTAIENAFGSLSSNPSQDKKQMAKLNEVLSGDINAVTSALKRYLRKLPDPLIPYALYDSYIRVGKNSTASPEERCQELLNRVILRLPPANRHALYLLGRHLEVVNLYNAVNRMNYKNLSVVFAPTIARDPTGEHEMTGMAPRNEATELLFSHFSIVLAGYEA